jgi:hypothetical protein
MEIDSWNRGQIVEELTDHGLDGVYASFMIFVLNEIGW